jgi:hypothetical protein
MQVSMAHLWLSPIFDMFKTQQLMVQKHGFWAKNHGIFKRGLLSFDDIEYRRPPKDALWKAA